MWFLLKFMGAVVLAFFGLLGALMLWRISPWALGSIMLVGAVGGVMHARHKQGQSESKGPDPDHPPTPPQ